MVVTTILLIPFFGLQPGSNPIASGILISVLIISCFLLMFNRYISSYFKSRKRDRKRVAIICPRCNIKVGKELGI
jgi:hypothetical protein